MPAAAEAPDWRPLVEQYLRPWATTGLSVVDVDRAEAWALNASAFSATGSWRASVAARRSSAAELLEAGYSRVSSEADLLRITGLCDMCKSSKRILPPSSCVRRPRVGVHRRPLPLCTLFTPPGGGRCFDPRCCKGWDCAARPLGCE